MAAAAVLVSRRDRCDPPLRRRRWRRLAALAHGRAGGHRLGEEALLRRPAGPGRASPNTGLDVQVDTAGTATDRHHGRPRRSTTSRSRRACRRRSKIRSRPPHQRRATCRSTRRWRSPSCKPIAKLLSRPASPRTRAASGRSTWRSTSTSSRRTRAGPICRATPTYPANKSVLITSTDVRTSNSAAMYLSIASYVANGEQRRAEHRAGRRGPADRQRRCSCEQGFTEHLVGGAVRRLPHDRHRQDADGDDLRGAVPRARVRERRRASPRTWS